MKGIRVNLDDKTNATSPQTKHEQMMQKTNNFIWEKLLIWYIQYTTIVSTSLYCVYTRHSAEHGSTS